MKLYALWTFLVTVLSIAFVGIILAVNLDEIILELVRRWQKRRMR